MKMEMFLYKTEREKNLRFLESGVFRVLNLTELPAHRLGAGGGEGANHYTALPFIDSSEPVRILPQAHCDLIWGWAVVRLAWAPGLNPGLFCY